MGIISISISISRTICNTVIYIKVIYHYLVLEENKSQEIYFNVIIITLNNVL